MPTRNFCKAHFYLLSTKTKHLEGKLVSLEPDLNTTLISSPDCTESLHVPKLRVILRRRDGNL